MSFLRRAVDYSSRWQLSGTQKPHLPQTGNENGIGIDKPKIGGDQPAFIKAFSNQNQRETPENVKVIWIIFRIFSHVLGPPFRPADDNEVKVTTFWPRDWPTVVLVAMTDMHWHSKLILISDTRASDTFPSLWLAAAAKNNTKLFPKHLFCLRFPEAVWFGRGFEMFGLEWGEDGPNWHPVTGQDIKWNDASGRGSGLSN